MWRDGRQQTQRCYGKPESHHRGLRPGHVLKGVARKLGRANWFLVEEERYQEIPPRGKIPASVWKPEPADESATGGDTNIKEGQRKVTGADS